MRQPGGDRAFVELLLLMRETSLDTLEMACELALESGVIQGSVIQNEMRKLSEPDRPKALPGVLDITLKTAPLPDCARYDPMLKGACHAH